MDVALYGELCEEESIASAIALIDRLFTRAERERKTVQAIAFNVMWKDPRSKLAAEFALFAHVTEKYPHQRNVYIGTGTGNFPIH